MLHHLFSIPLFLSIPFHFSHSTFPIPFQHLPALEVEEENKLEDVFDDSTTASASMAATTANQPANAQEKIKRPPIRKRFRWTDEIRCGETLLCV